MLKRQFLKRKKGKNCVYDHRSFFLFSHETRFRKFIVNITESSIFDAIIILAIVINSLVLAITDYTDRNDEMEYNKKL